MLAARDWNFTEDPEDGSHQLAGPTLNAWERLKAKHSIREVAQPTATYYGAGDVYSRIDRVYTSYTEADQALASLEAYVMPRPCIRDKTTVVGHKDHYPLSMVAHPNEPPSKRLFVVPAWLFDDPVFVAMLRDKINRHRGLARNETALRGPRLLQGLRYQDRQTLLC